MIDLVTVPNDLRIPDTFDILAGADTGTYMSGLIAALSPDKTVYFLEEFPNYRYAGGVIETTGMTVSEWFEWFGTRLAHYTKKKKNPVWVDANTTFKGEVKNGVSFLMNQVHLERRVEIMREYRKANSIWIAPWLRILPYEMEAAKFPDQVSNAGRYVRLKVDDHTLDCGEHIVSRRPRTKTRARDRQTSFLEKFMAEHKIQSLGPLSDPHLGSL